MTLGYFQNQHYQLRVMCSSMSLLRLLQKLSSCLGPGFLLTVVFSFFSSSICDSNYSVCCFLLSGHHPPSPSESQGKPGGNDNWVVCTEFLGMPFASTTSCNVLSKECEKFQVLTDILSGCSDTCFTSEKFSKQSLHRGICVVLWN